MKRCSESRKETAPQNLLSPRTTTQVGTWNGRTMYETGKNDAAAEMRWYKLAVLGLCETRWTRSWQIRLATGDTLIYSGHEEEDAPHTQAVGLMLSKGAAGALLDWKAFSSHFISARFHTRIREVLIVQCYAPNKRLRCNEKLYGRLQAVVDQKAKKDLLIMMGYFNAKIGKDNIGKELVMGKEGLGEINENGELFTDFCHFNILVIGGSVLPYKMIHKTTWISPHHQTENQIDHICISNTFRRSLQDVRSKRGADVGTGHHLVTGKIKFKLKRYHPTAAKLGFRYNPELLTDITTKYSFQIGTSKHISTPVQAHSR